ncbi:TetR/AcrR family transcriptional regulator [Streptomyces meridianus]|uniref:TetR/AcrR family transcriptional regulator n=1 Tax=Streptomyces meridianus TaxID=2938945 RepID=A0ABT0XDF1_9ACTN|nr:TetR/AcrR family transcriptional regulator [Streptomyces meridianus]MCM2580555.1 TetR/AcrR family transcriptional regulator [Streptomyces meridianus]
MHIQDSHLPSAASAGSSHTAGDSVVIAAPFGGVASKESRTEPVRPAPLRVDAQRNLEHVVRAAREVFGESGYGAPMEDVARRARVGVGTVYRRFHSKEILVGRIADEETARLTEQARVALKQEDEPWAALSRFLKTAVASGSGRLLPPQLLRVGAAPESLLSPEDESARVPQQRRVRAASELGGGEAGFGNEAPQEGPPPARPGVESLLDVVGQLVDRARAAGELRTDVTVSDILLVMATPAPSLPDAGRQEAASARLLDILLDGLRSRTRN